MKNAKDVGWYKLKQCAVTKQIHEVGSASLSHAQQLALIVPAWNNAFSKEVNLLGWKKGGFASDGIRMTPLWAQRKKDDCVDVKQRAFSKAEQRRGAIEKLGLNNTYEFDKILRLGSQKRTVAELTAEAEAVAANAEGDDDGDEVEDGSSTFTTRSFVCEQQRLRVPANGAAGTKLRDFHDQIIELSMSLIQPSAYCSPTQFLILCPFPRAQKPPKRLELQN